MPITGAVLAGGTSRRMGTDKRGLEIDGVPLLRRAALAVAAVVDDLVVACGIDAPVDPGLLDGIQARIVVDRLRDAGPLAGLEAALAAAHGELVAVVAADMPWIAQGVLRLLVDEARDSPTADVVALGTGGGPEPLVAVYRRRILPVVTALLDGGERRLTSLLADVAVTVVPPARWKDADRSGRTPMNLNTPGEVASARAGEGGPGPGG